MGWTFWLPQVLLGASLLTAVLIFPLAEERGTLRTALNLGGATVKLLLVGVMFWGSLRGHHFEARLPFLAEQALILRVDYLGLLFVTLSAILWFLTTVYAVGYLEGSPHRSRFFGFFSVCVSATVGIALAGNLFTFVVFYEILTLSTYPLVVHRGTAASLAAGAVYLRYTLAGGAVLLLATVWLYALVGRVDFAVGEAVAAVAETHRGPLATIFLLLVAGLGVKAALVPFHSWLPVAMIAPAPVSALLHAVAVVKAGAFGIVRVVYDVYGIRVSEALGVSTVLAVMASVTILYGSVQALRQTDMKRRLAFSTVSQVSYIALGVAIAGPSATVGGVVHLVHQGLMKITLFFCAGNLAESLHLHRIADMDGVARRMPWTMTAFTVAAFGMMGVPPLAGFVTKWYLGVGAITAGQPWVLAVLVVSSLLNAAYFLPVVARAWFRAPQGAWVEEAPRRGRLEVDAWLLLPPLATGASVLVLGLLAGAPLSPLSWADFIAMEIFERP
jgi:multicomponent Na+:H+ antiporter subunit D